MRDCDTDLPPGWAEATIGDLIGAGGVFTDGDWIETKDQDPAGQVRLTQLADIGEGRFLDRSARFLTAQKARELRCTFLEPGDVLIARMPDPLGRACTYPGGPRPAVTAVDVCIVRSGVPGVNHRWLMWFINSPDFRAAVESMQSGSTRKRISRRNLGSIRLPVPPRREQDRITERLDAQFTRLDAAVAALERARANLKRYRASVLKAACEGRLVPTEAELARREGRDYEPADVLLQRILRERRARWEAEELERLKAKGKPPTDDRWKQKYKEPEPPDTSGLPELPEGWVWTSLEHLLVAPLLNGRSVMSRADGFPVLRLTSIRNGRIDLSEWKGGDWTRDEAEGFLVKSGDFLVARGNGSLSLVGRGGFVGAVDCEVAFPDTLIRVRLPPDGLEAAFFGYLWDSVIVRHQIETAARTTAGIFKINHDDLRALVLPIPPFAEQVRIAAVVGRQLSIATEIERQLTRDLARAGQLRQSILKLALRPSRPPGPERRARERAPGADPA